jgi:hypothetical protein
MLKCSLVPLLLALPAALPAQFTTHLSPRAERAFENYRKAAEANLDWTPRLASRLKPGEIAISPTSGQGYAEVTDGLVHDWMVATVVPHATPEQVIAVLQDYGAYKNVYHPDVVDSKLLRREGDLWHVQFKLAKKKVFTVLLNSEFDVEYHPLGDGRWSVVSRSARIAELDGERELPPGNGYGFLWRLNTYWLIEPHPEGVYMECRTVSLSREIPAGLGWIVKPFVVSVPKESLFDTMQDTVRALRRVAQEDPAIPQHKIHD